MSDVMPKRGEDRPRVPGFVSAVLLLVLLATTGLPAEQRPWGEGGAVAVLEVASTRPAARLVEQGEERRALAAIAASPQRTRARHRALRVETGGLPPPRAPTA